nr:uncharacterized protein DDB_G0283697-like [Onthophagus taurus]XP_022911290.1 uncharacterized protein DDB_G0283697-like [Onthophagus taurus]
MRRKSRKTDPENGNSNEPEENPENGSENAETEEDVESEVKKSKSPKKGEKSPKKATKGEKRTLKDTTEDENQKNGAKSDQDEGESESGERETKRRKTSKTPKKGAKSNKKNVEEEVETEEEEQYEVEAVVDSKTINGVKHYLIRWKGYDASSDTWESKDSLNCPELIKEFNENTKKKSPKKKSRKKKSTTNAKNNDDNENEENAEYEVDKIVEVHHKRNGKKEFLVSWKGYPPSQDSWVDEEDMDCKDLIAKFMAKVEQVKNVTPKQLRENRAQTDRFTLTTREHGRRLSRRNKGKQRVQYHNTE